MCLFWPQNTFCLILSLFLFQKVKTVVFPFFGMFSTEPFHVQSIAPRQRFFISQNKLQNQNVNFALKYRENMTWWAYSIWKYNIFFRFDVCSHKIVAIDTWLILQHVPIFSVWIRFACMNIPKQKPIANYVCSLFILFARPIQVKTSCVRKVYNVWFFQRSDRN